MKLKNKIDEALDKIGGTTKQIPNTPVENKLLNTIITDQKRAETSKSEIDETWDNEYLMYSGDQWSTTLAYRSPSARKVRPNSVDNFIMPAITNGLAALTGNTPDTVIEPGDSTDKEDAEVAANLTHVSAAIKTKNKFPALWKKMVLDFISHGPIIGAVLWDPDWLSGSGPNRTIGDVRLLQIKRKEFYPDPSILDLEERLQDCSFINRKLRRKLAYYKERWPERGYLVTTDEDTDEDEGQEHNQASLFEHWHRGKPKFIPPETKKELLQKAQEAELRVMMEAPDPYKAEQYRAMAEGDLDGIHVAYVTADIFLEYKPYIYEDGLYPFVYKTLYQDEKSPWGFGEIRNIISPQIGHNKADEIELEAMSKEGLGGAYYNKGSVSAAQKAEILNTQGKGGAWNEVNDVNGVKDKTGAKVPASVTNYKEHKQRMVETVSGNTPIQQGMSPGANVPMGTIRELGARVDTRTKGKAEILEDFLVDFERLIISRVGQFYQETRSFAYRDRNNNMITGKFSNRDMMRQWEREPASKDPEGNEIPPKMETYIPDFYPKVKVVDEKPTNRDYYVDMAFKLYDMQILDEESLLDAIDEGKLPPTEKIMEKLKAKKAELTARQPPPAQGPIQGQPAGQMDPLQIIQQLPPEQQAQMQQMLQTNPQQAMQLLQEIMGGGM